MPLIWAISHSKIQIVLAVVIEIFLLPVYVESKCQYCVKPLNQWCCYTSWNGKCCEYPNGHRHKDMLAKRINDTNAFTCTSSYASCWKCPDAFLDDCGQLYNISSSKPWYAKIGREDESYFEIQFYRTVRITKIEIQHLQKGWFKEISLSFSGGQKTKEVNLTNGPANAWNTITINPPIETTDFKINTMGVHHTPQQIGAMAYGIQELRFYGNNVQTACKMKRLWNHKLRWIMLECGENEICDTPTGKCLSGCIHSDQCETNEYCNVETHKCQVGNVQCGKPLLASQGRILGGKEVSLSHSQPWMVVVGFCLNCGGTLISKKHVLTAAHCGNPSEVILGKHNCGYEKYDMGELFIKVKTVDIHPNFWLKYGAAGYDFAVLTLERSVKFSSTILPACLPTSSSETYLDAQATATGWGKIGPFSDPRVTNQFVRMNEGPLMTVNITVLPISECEKAKWLTDKIEWIETHCKEQFCSQNIKLINETYTLCAGEYEGDVGSSSWKGPHQGDSGGPLTIQDPDSGLQIVIGVISDGPFTFKEYKLGPVHTFARVNQVLPWISDAMKGKFHRTSERPFTKSVTL